jgi:hypothetical protein
VFLGAVLVLGGPLALAAPGRVPAGTFTGCPRRVAPLPRPAPTYAPAARKAVLRFVRNTLSRESRTLKKLVDAETTNVVLVRQWLPSGWIKTECGVGVWERSIAVGVYFPALDLPHNPVGRCGDCDHITFLLSRTPGGWSVWGDY